MWNTADDLVAWLAERPPATGVRLARLLADTKTAGALREFADQIVFDMTREATYDEVAKALGQSRKQVMHAVERQRGRLSS